jgi:hypothetical protein
MKNVLTPLFLVISYISWAQTSSWLNAELAARNVTSYARLSFSYADNNCSNVYAVTLNTNKTIILNACTQKVEKDTLKEFQNMGQIFLGTNDQYYYLCNDQIINESGWLPLKIKKSSFDSIVYLDFHNFLGFKGNQKWILNLDLLLMDPLNYQKIDFIGNEYLRYNGGLIVRTSVSGIIKYRYVQYANLVTGYDENGETISDPNFHYLSSDRKFEADSILLHNYSEEVMLISNNDHIFIYSFCSDEVIEKDIKSYYLTNPLVIVQEDYIAYPDGCIWKKLDIPNVISLDFDNQGDFIFGQANTSTGQSFKIDFFSGEVEKIE